MIFRYLARKKKFVEVAEMSVIVKYLMSLNKYVQFGGKYKLS